MTKRKESNYNRICEYCKKSYVNKRSADGNRYCSRKCANHVNLHIAKALTDKVIIGKKCNVYFKVCIYCGNNYVAKLPKSLICSSIDCIKRNKKKYYKGYSPKSYSSKKVVIDRSCKECKAVFRSEFKDNRTVFCSINCSKRYSRRITDAKKRKLLRSVTVESVDPIKVFDRDKWKCCLCGIKTPKNKRGSYDNNAPEMDHIISLAEGGDHSYRNTQCLCRRCNAEKGASTKGQFLLFG